MTEPKKSSLVPGFERFNYECLGTMPVPHVMFGWVYSIFSALTFTSHYWVHAVSQKEKRKSQKQHLQDEGKDQAL